MEIRIKKSEEYNAVVEVWQGKTLVTTLEVKQKVAIGSKDEIFITTIPNCWKEAGQHEFHFTTDS